MFLLLLVLRCFTSQGALFYHKDKNCRGLLDRVSPFGNLRIKGCYTPPRSLSQLRHVLHRLLKSRHPPYALKFPVKKFENHNLFRLYHLAEKAPFPDRSVLWKLSSVYDPKRPSSKCRDSFKFSNIQSFFSQTKNRLSSG